MEDLMLLDVFQSLSRHPHLLKYIKLDDVMKFIDLASLTRPYIQQLQSIHIKSAPETLPVSVHNFLASCLKVPDDILKLLWEVLRRSVWAREYNDTLREQLATQYLPYFLEHGPSQKIGYYALLPPTRVCVECVQHLRKRSNHVVQDRELVQPVEVPVTVFTQRHGPIPGFSTSLYCQNCKTRYHPNYYVHKGAKLRTYYLEKPNFVHISTHSYLDSRTCDMFTSMMLRSWSSGTNCARIYNESLSDNELTSLLPSHTRQLELDDQLVWNGLFLYWLIEDSLERGCPLELEHDASSQKLRLDAALEARNARMAGPGQEEWNHACDGCCWVSEEKDGTETYLRSVVVDGVTVGHPCCGVHDCTVPLTNVKDRFCPGHISEWNEKCAITICKAKAETGLRTCPIPAHRKLEDWINLQNKAMFQLRQRAARTGGPLQADDTLAPPDEGNDLEPEELVEVDENGICDGKPAEGNRRIRAQFGRKRTHNEELCVTSCGVIIGRATFYGSEAPNGVRTFLMALFPTKMSLPRVIWHDNNCRILAMLENDTDEWLKHYFDGCALPVDVFHFKCKHKATDELCNRRCNPVNWPELRDGEKWRFNSSAAEQANAWFGKYLPVVREMHVHRYEFFLDEMIKRRNRLVIKELKKKYKAPYNIPRADLGL